MSNETWTDWMIQCDMLQDSSGFSALDWLYYIRPDDLHIRKPTSSCRSTQYAKAYPSGYSRTSTRIYTRIKSVSRKEVHTYRMYTIHASASLSRTRRQLNSTSNNTQADNYTE